MVLTLSYKSIFTISSSRLNRYIGGGQPPAGFQGQPPGGAPASGGSMEGVNLPPGVAIPQSAIDPLESVLGPFPCARLRGLAYEASLEDVLVFFQGLVVLDVVVVPVFAAAGPDAKAEAGEAFVVFANPMDFQMALQRDRQTMGGRSIEVYRGKREDYYAAIAMVSFARPRTLSHLSCTCVLFICSRHDL